MTSQDNFSILSPEAPNLLSVRTGVVGTSDAPIDFTYGGTSDLPDGSQNPEDYAAFPQAMYDEGLISPGQAVTVMNPATKKRVVVIARHAKTDNETGMDLAPHSVLELGPSSDKKYVLDLKPVKGYPVAQYSKASVEGSAFGNQQPAARTSTGINDAASLGDVSLEDTIARTSTGVNDAADETIPTAPGAWQSGSAMASLDADQQVEGGAPQEGGTSSGNATHQPVDKYGGQLSQDGTSITYPSGITVYKDGHWTHQVAPGVLQSYEYGSLRPTKIVDPNYKSQVMDSKLEKMMIDRKLSPFNTDGTPLKASEAVKQINEFDQKNGIMTPVQEKIAQQIAQQLNTSRNPAISGYYKIKPKYDSITENISAKPMNQRNGVDDAYLLNAAAGIENVDRAPTQNDYTEMLRAAGYRGSLQVASERLWGLFNNDPKYYTERGTRILSDEMVRQIQQNADRVLAPRKKLLLNALAPIRERLKTHGIPENQVIPDGLIDEQSAPTPKTLQNPAPPIKPGGIIIAPDKTGKKIQWRLRDGGDPANPKDYLPLQ